MNARRIAAAAVAASGVGIVIQIAAHVHYPTVPPGLIIVAAAAAVAAFVPRRWAALAAVLSGAGTLVGGLANAPWRERLSGVGSIGAVAGTWVQIAAGSIGLVAGLLALRLADRGESAPVDQDEQLPVMAAPATR
jgi:hypothetical protein